LPDRREFRLRLRQRGIGFQAPHHSEASDLAPRIEGGSRQLLERDPQIVVVRELHVGRHDADNRHHFAVGLDSPTQNGGVAAVAFLPHAVGQNRHRLGALRVVISGEGAADDRLFTNDRKQGG
jgi:hypothetical protein